ncbi:MAG: right-handed parallel beta-helix repeat-containing protein, partial [Endozoicomonas sp.]
MLSQGRRFFLLCLLGILLFGQVDDLSARTYGISIVRITEITNKDTGVVTREASIPGGTIDEDVTLDGTVTLSGTVTIAKGVTLTLKPGTRVYGDSGSVLFVDGNLQAVGTKENPIVFTSAQPAPQAGDWGGINFDSGSTGKLEYVTVEYAGSDYYRRGTTSILNVGVYIDDSSPVLNHVRVQHIADSTDSSPEAYGIYITGSASPTVTNSVVSDTSDHGIYLYGSGSPVLTNNVVGNEGEKAGVAIRGTIAQDLTLDGEVTLAGSVTVVEGVTLTLLPGATVYGTGNSVLYVDGNLQAVGTEENPILFTSASAEPETGDWEGIHFYPNSTGMLEYTTVEYAGAKGYRRGSTASLNVGVYINDSSPVLNHVRVRHIGDSTDSSREAYGIYIVGSASPTITNSVVSDTTDHGIYLSGTGAPVLANNAVGNEGEKDGVAIEGTIAQDLTLDGEVTLAGSVTVAEGVTLTLQPGTIVFGDSNSSF